jgi:hypothetical protein
MLGVAAVEAECRALDAEQLRELAKMLRGVRDGDEPASRAEHSRQLAQR